MEVRNAAVGVSRLLKKVPTFALTNTVASEAHPSFAYSHKCYTTEQ